VNAGHTVDALLTETAVVFGSLPPTGRDLDLLVSTTAHKQITEALADAGFQNARNQWVRFDGCESSSVDIVPVSRWYLNKVEEDTLFDQALPIDGYRHLRQPAPHHTLLMLARRVVAGTLLDDKKRARIRAALVANPAAWDDAQKCANAWQAVEAISVLERYYKTGVPPGLRRRALASAADARSSNQHGAPLGALKKSLRRGRAGFVVAMSGLDGSGKSSQAEALRRTLDSLGYDATVVWSRLAYNPTLNLVATPVKRALLLVRGESKRARTANAGEAQAAGKELRRESSVLTWAWAVVVAMLNGATHRRIVGYHLKRGRAVICDRYVLDSAVHLRYRYGPERPFRLPRAIVKALSPKPAAAFYLDVEARVALERKKEQYDIDQLTLQADLYREEAGRMGVKRLDGSNTTDRLCREIATAVWSAIAATDEPPRT
jgi:thymidylate kinase